MSDSLCIRSLVTVRGMSGEKTVSGWRLGDWAVHAQIDDPRLFCITWLPHGLSLPFDWASFRSRDKAIGAMADIVRLKNSWEKLSQSDLKPDLKKALQHICKCHGAVNGAAQVGLKLDAKTAPFTGASLDKLLNGYR